MASVDSEICAKILSNENLIRLLFRNVLYEMDDSMSLIQLFRLFTLFLVDNCKERFLDYIKTELRDASSLIVAKINFILEQSLNHQLLDALSLFLVDLLDTSDQEVLSYFASTQFVNSVCNANITLNEFLIRKKLADEDNVNVDETPRVGNFVRQDSICDISVLDKMCRNYFICLQILSTFEEGVKALCEARENLFSLFAMYSNECLDCFNDWEIRSSNSLDIYATNDSLTNFNCLVSVFNCILINDSKKSYTTDEKFEIVIKNILKICKPYIYLISQKMKETQSEDDDQLMNANFMLAAKYAKEFLSAVDLLKLDFKDYQIEKLIEDCKHINF